MQAIGSDKFATHTICPAQSGKFTIARYFFDSESEGAAGLPFTLRESHSLEGGLCKIMVRFEINRKLVQQIANASRDGRRVPSFEQI